MDILIIEDHKIHQVVLINIICNIASNLSNDNIVVKNNGREALDFIKSAKKEIDLIFTDLKMPEMNGLEFAQKLRKIDHSTPIVLITCNYEEIEKTKNESFDYLIKKPINTSYLKNILSKYNKNKIDHYI